MGQYGTVHLARWRGSAARLPLIAMALALPTSAVADFCAEPVSGGSFYDIGPVGDIILEGNNPELIIAQRGLFQLTLVNGAFDLRPVLAESSDRRCGGCNSFLAIDVYRTSRCWKSDFG